MTRAPAMPLIELSSMARTLHAARLGRRTSQQPRAIGYAGAARSAALVARAAGVAHDDIDLVEADVQLFGDDLRHRDVEPLPHVHLAEERLNAAVWQHGDPRVELTRHERRLARGLRHDFAHRRGERDNERAGSLEKF